MTDFSTSTKLEVEVDERSLRDARSTIEGRVGSVTVSPQQTRADGGRNRGTESRSRENAMSRQLLEQQIELLDDIQDDVERLAQSGGGGGGGGGLLGGGGGLLEGVGGGAIGSRLTGGLGSLGGLAAGGAGLAAGGGLSILLASWWLSRNMEGDQRDPREVGSNPREPGSDGPNVMAAQGTADRGANGSGDTTPEEPSAPGVRRDPTGNTERRNIQDGVLMANRGNGEELGQQDGVLQDEGDPIGADERTSQGQADLRREQVENQQPTGHSPARTSESALRDKLGVDDGGGPQPQQNVNVQVDASVETNDDRVVEDVITQVEQQLRPELEGQIDEVKQQLIRSGQGMGGGI